MSSANESNLERLREAGIITEEGVSVLRAEQRQKIEALAAREVDTLIQVYRQVGPIEVGVHLI